MRIPSSHFPVPVFPVIILHFLCPGREDDRNHVDMDPPDDDVDQDIPLLQSTFSLGIAHTSTLETDFTRSMSFSFSHDSHVVPEASELFECASTRHESSERCVSVTALLPSQYPSCSIGALKRVHSDNDGADSHLVPCCVGEQPDSDAWLHMQDRLVPEGTRDDMFCTAPLAGYLSTSRRAWRKPRLTVRNRSGPVAEGYDAGSFGMTAQVQSFMATHASLIRTEVDKFHGVLLKLVRSQRKLAKLLRLTRQVRSTQQRMPFESSIKHMLDAVMLCMFYVMKTNNFPGELTDDLVLTVYQFGHSKTYLFLL